MKETLFPIALFIILFGLFLVTVFNVNERLDKAEISIEEIVDKLETFRRSGLTYESSVSKPEPSVLSPNETGVHNLEQRLGKAELLFEDIMAKVERIPPGFLANSIASNN